MTDQAPPNSSQPNRDESNQQSMGSRETIAPSGLELDPKNSGPFPALPVTFGRFEVRKHLGKGAMGTVYLAFDPELNKPEISNQVAIKIPLLQTSDDSTLLERFCREAQATGAMNHPNICKLYEVGEIAGTHYISMEYIDGRPLADYIGQDQQPQLPRQVAGIIRKLAQGLAHAHERGFIHRDLKPTNVMIATNGQPKIMDFGLARRFGVTGDIRLTQSNTIVGSPAYMSPEQARSENDTLTPASDIYSLGTLFFELLTCELPFKGPLAVVLGMVALNRVPKPSSIRPDVDPRLEVLCLKMLEKKIESRPKSMTEVADSLAEWLRPAASKSNPVMSLMEEPVALTPKKPAAPSAAKTDGIENQKRRVTDLLDQHEYGAAISHLEKMTHLKDARFAPLVAWAKPKLKEVRATEQELRKSSAPTCDTAEQLLKHYDYAGAVALLTAVPFAYRSLELRDLLNKATELHDECEHLQRSIQEAIHTGDKDELPGLVKGLLKLKPNNKAIKQLAAEVKELGAAKVIARRKGQRQIFDPAGRVVEPSQVIFAVLLVAVIFGAVGFLVRNYLATSQVSGPMKSPERTGPLTKTTPIPGSHGGSEPNPLAQSITSSSTTMKLALIPAGTFLMGSPATEASRSWDEGPQHSVQITKPFYVGTHEVTQSQYQAVMGHNPSLISKTGAYSGRVTGMDTSHFPVENVSWFDAIEFCNKLSEKDGLPAYYKLTEVVREASAIRAATVTMNGGNGRNGYRLPTEAEWEYVCRAGTATPFHFGSSSNGSEANVDGAVPYGTTNQDAESRTRTTSVGSYKQNAFGLFDMHGNVSEWCFDVYDDQLYQTRTGTTPDPVKNEFQSYRVLRGGSHFNYPVNARAAFRLRYHGGYIGHHVGFRVARSTSGSSAVGAASSTPVTTPIRSVPTSTNTSSRPTVPPPKTYARATLYRVLLDAEEYLSWSRSELTEIRGSFSGLRNGENARRRIMPLGEVQTESSTDTVQLLRHISSQNGLHHFGLTAPTGSNWRNEGGCFVPRSAGRNTVALHRLTHSKTGLATYRLAPDVPKLRAAGLTDRGIVCHVFVSSGLSTDIPLAPDRMPTDSGTNIPLRAYTGDPRFVPVYSIDIPNTLESWLTTEYWPLEMRAKAQQPQWESVRFQRLGYAYAKPQTDARRLFNYTHLAEGRFSCLFDDKPKLGDLIRKDEWYPFNGYIPTKELPGTIPYHRIVHRENRKQLFWSREAWAKRTADVNKYWMDRGYVFSLLKEPK